MGFVPRGHYGSRSGLVLKGRKCNLEHFSVMSFNINKFLSFLYLILFFSIAYSILMVKCDRCKRRRRSISDFARNKLLNESTDNRLMDVLEFCGLFSSILVISKGYDKALCRKNSALCGFRTQDLESDNRFISQQRYYSIAFFVF